MRLQITEQPTTAETEVTSARNKGAAGNAGKYQNTRFVDPVLKDAREDEMNENLGLDPMIFAMGIYFLTNYCLEP